MNSFKEGETVLLTGSTRADGLAVVERLTKTQVVVRVLHPLTGEPREGEGYQYRFTLDGREVGSSSRWHRLYMHKAKPTQIEALKHKAKYASLVDKLTRTSYSKYPIEVLEKLAAILKEANP